MQGSVEEHGLPEAYSSDQFGDMVLANSAVDIGREHADRLLSVASSADVPREADGITAVVGTNWQSFASDRFGEDSVRMTNRFAIGSYQPTVSAEQQAALFTDTVVVQQSWLESGDDALTRTQPYEAQYDGGDEGEMWIPHSAMPQEDGYVLALALAPAILDGQQGLAGASA